MLVNPVNLFSNLFKELHKQTKLKKNIIHHCKINKFHIPFKINELVQFLFIND